MNLDEQLVRIQSPLAVEEPPGAANGPAVIARRQGDRRKISDELPAIAREIRLLITRLRWLRELPPTELMRWAQSVLAYPDGRIMIVDTVFPAEDAGIVQILLSGFTGTIHYDQYMAPVCLLSRQRMQEPGLAPQDLHDAPSLAQIWPSLLEALRAMYIVSYDYRYLKRILEKTAGQCELESPLLTGEFLLQRCLSYYQASGYVGLAPLCRLVGYPLPEPPDCTATDRAGGQLHLLQAMSWDSRGRGYVVPMGQSRGSDIEEDRAI